MDWSIIIGVLSAVITVFLTAFLSYFFSIQYKKSEYRESSKRELVERLNRCSNNIPYKLSAIGISLGFTPTNNEEGTKNIDTDGNIIEKNTLAFIKTHSLNNISTNFIAALNKDFNSDFLKLSDAWAEFLELRTFMRSRKVLQKYYIILEQFFYNNTALITDFLVLAKTDFVEKIKQDLITLLNTEIGTPHSDEQKILIRFFKAINKWSELLKNVEEKVIADIKY